jgi:23S rRNA (cytidine1920-2'-O)/16S rRNA (cytidine1409-2'-O)-methyltransferase
MPKTRLDQRVHALGLTPSREQARRLIMAGEVLVDGQVILRPSALVAAEARIELRARPRFVSRGGEKLEAALAGFGLDVAGRVCADVGASTGGFTDALLQRGAARVYAIDVGHGILDYRLRTDPRVVVMERTNARYVASLPEPVHIVTIDAAFISLKLLLPVAAGWLAPGGEVVALIKPQFEAGRGQVGKGGIVKDPAVHRQVLTDLLGWAAAAGLGPAGLMRSPLKGAEGNVEFLAWMRPGGASLDTDPAIEAALRERPAPAQDDEREGAAGSPQNT